MFAAHRRQKWTRRRPLSRAELALKCLIGVFFGVECLGGPLLLMLGVFWDYEWVRRPPITTTFLLGFAMIGSFLAVRFLPAFSRDRGRIADFLIDPASLGPLADERSRGR